MHSLETWRKVTPEGTIVRASAHSPQSDRADTRRPVAVVEHRLAGNHHGAFSGGCGDVIDAACGGGGAIGSSCQRCGCPLV